MYHNFSSEERGAEVEFAHGRLVSCGLAGASAKRKRSRSDSAAIGLVERPVGPGHLLSLSEALFAVGADPRSSHSDCSRWEVDKKELCSILQGLQYGKGLANAGGAGLKSPEDVSI